VPIALRIRTGVAVLTYQDQLTIGVTADYDSGREVDLLADAIAASFAELVGETRSAKARRPAPRKRAATPGKAAAAPRRGQQRTTANRRQSTGHGRDATR
jgi:hypothetical protein